MSIRHLIFSLTQGDATMSTPTSSTGNDSGILLEAGTNELEVLAISLSGQNYGVNVAKVREVLDAVEPTKLPESHPAVEGTFQIRDEVVLLVNLARALNFSEEECRPCEDDRILVMEFNEHRVAFRVQSVDRILRVSWRNVRPMPMVGSTVIPVTGVLVVDDAMIQMLDFESIGIKIGMTHKPARVVVQVPEEECDWHDLPIVFADDSMMVRAMVQDALSDAGYRNIKGFSDGDDAWNYLKDASDAIGNDTNTGGESVAAIITDVEMPRMDGLHLTKRIRENASLRNVPVILFSSIVSRDNQKKGEQVGANAQVAKPHYGDLVETLGGLVCDRIGA